MSRSALTTARGIGTRYCCDGCGVSEDDAPGTAPSGWRTRWAVALASPGATRLRREDRCAACDAPIGGDGWGPLLAAPVAARPRVVQATPRPRLATRAAALLAHLHATAR